MKKTEIISRLSVDKNLFFEWLYDNYSSRIYGIAFYATKSPLQAEEILKSSFIYAAKNIKNAVKDENFQIDNWISNIASCHVIKYNRENYTLTSPPVFIDDAILNC